jgi:hypothetical protein
MNSNKVKHDNRHTHANLCADGRYLCYYCAICESERLADVDPQCPDDDQWRIIGAQSVQTYDRCDHCGHLIRTPITDR